MCKVNPQHCRKRRNEWGREEERGRGRKGRGREGREGIKPGLLGYSPKKGKRDGTVV